MQGSNHDHAFWTDRNMEHLTFISQDLAPMPGSEPWIDRAAELQTQWNALKYLSYSPELAVEMRYFLNAVKPYLHGCEPDLIDHMLLELQFYQSLMEGTLTPDAELQFWLQEHKSALDYVKCNLPQESPLQLQLSETVLNFTSLPPNAPFQTMVLRENYLLLAQMNLQQQNRQLGLGLPDDRLTHEHQETEYARGRMIQYTLMGYP
jgi:hypothetical protein